MRTNQHLISRFLLICLFFPTLSFSKSEVNLYLWGDDIPKELIHQFEKETGISVNLSSYDNNETMLAKLSASARGMYDVIMPSGNYIERMQHKGLLSKLDKTKLPNLRNLDTKFKTLPYDPDNQVSIPLTWGTSGIFYNQERITKPPKSWAQLWDQSLTNKLLLLDDAREVFSFTLMSIGYSPNDTNPDHIYQAYKRLEKLIPNIKLFANDGLQAMIIDEDASIGIAWSNDAYKAHEENAKIQYVYPNEGFIIWVDNLAIPSNAPHTEEAYTFINYMLKAEVAATIGQSRGLGITNKAGWELLPLDVQRNRLIYPDTTTLNRGYYQHDVGEKIIALYNRYWSQLKLSF